MGRLISAVLAFFFCSFMAGVFLLLLGDATGWLNVHSGTTAPMWWRIAYLILTLVGTPAIGIACAVAAWRSGAK